MCNKKIVNTFLIVLLLCIGGCALHRDKSPHNNVLVFGTTTKFALDVAAPVQNASIPEFTLGYKRLEAVWMPLKPNNEIDAGSQKNISKLVGSLNECMSGLSNIGLNKSQLANFCLTSILPADKYVSISSGVDSQKGGNSIEIDTYSVFASLGAKGALSFSNASGNLAQFFATGVAAQRLGANPAVGFALNAEAPKAAEAAAAAEKSKVELQIEKEKKNAGVQLDLIAKGKVVAASVLGGNAQPVDSAKRAVLATKMTKLGAGCNDAYLSTLDQSTVEKFIAGLKFQCLRELGLTIE